MSRVKAQSMVGKNLKLPNKWSPPNHLAGVYHLFLIFRILRNNKSQTPAEKYYRGENKTAGLLVELLGILSSFIVGNTSTGQFSRLCYECDKWKQKPYFS
jgi:hypothetical protein